MPNRTLCAVLEELRTCFETRNFSYMISLLEEAQSLGNRMEAGLWDQKEVKYLREEMRELKDEKAALKAEIKSLEDMKKLIK